MIGSRRGAMNKIARAMGVLFLLQAMSGHAQEDTTLGQPVLIDPTVLEGVRSEASSSGDVEAEVVVSGSSDSSYVANCPSGYRNMGLTCYRGPDDISAGSRAADCPSGYRNMGLTCYRGTDDYRNPSRVADCPSGYTNMGLTCFKPPWTSKGTSSMSCPRGWFRTGGRCYKNCRDGYKSMGETCHRSPSTLTSAKMQCKRGEFLNKELGRCYKECPSGYKNTGEFCHRPADSKSSASMSCNEPGHVLVEESGRCFPSGGALGAACDIGRPCSLGYECLAVSHECVPEGLDLDSSLLCGDLAIDDLVERADRGNQILSFGFGTYTTVGSLETGTVYGPRGEFACYATACFGGATDLTAGSYGANGWYPAQEFGAFSGKSYVVSGGVSSPIAEVGITGSGVYSENGVPIGIASSVGVGVGVTPIQVGFMGCSTRLVNENKKLLDLSSLANNAKSESRNVYESGNSRYGRNGSRLDRVRGPGDFSRNQRNWNEQRPTNRAQSQAFTRNGGSGSSSSSSTAISYGEDYYVRNQYGGGTYLDSCGRASCAGSSKYNVLTSSVKDRDGVGTGVWRIESATGKPKGAQVAIGDSVHLRNKYAGGSYLDSCGYVQCTSGTLYGVCTDSNRNRASGTGLWIVQSADGKANGSPVSQGDPLYLKNQYGEGSWLDSCGNEKCAGQTKYGVTTNTRPNRSTSGTGIWSFVK